MISDMNYANIIFPFMNALLRTISRITNCLLLRCNLLTNPPF